MGEESKVEPLKAQLEQQNAVLIEPPLVAAIIEPKSSESAASSSHQSSSGTDGFPDRPYMSVQEAIKAKDYDAILPFVKQGGFNPNQQTMPQNKRLFWKIY